MISEIFFYFSIQESSTFIKTFLLITTTTINRNLNKKRYWISLDLVNEGILLGDIYKIIKKYPYDNDLITNYTVKKTPR